MASACARVTLGDASAVLTGRAELSFSFMRDAVFERACGACVSCAGAGNSDVSNRVVATTAFGGSGTCTKVNLPRGLPRGIALVAPSYGSTFRGA